MTTTLPVGSTIVMVVVIALAAMAMVFVPARANRSNAESHSRPRRIERPSVRVPGVDPAAERVHARAAGHNPSDGTSVQPGGHVVRQRNPVAAAEAELIEARKDT